ncbi:8161_t:CDS:2 [Entrophospora sp. SA101]|nr:8161_t:CDS:2 [Entrophospora sp. SA101]
MTRAAVNITGTTLHSFAVIGLNAESTKELIEKIKKSKIHHFRWQSIEAFVIDEVSTFDGDLFDKLEEIAQTIHNNHRPLIRLGIVTKKTLEIMDRLKTPSQYPNDGIQVTEFKIQNKPHIYHAKDYEPEEIGQLKTLIKDCLVPNKLKLKCGAQIVESDKENETLPIVRFTENKELVVFEAEWRLMTQIDDVDSSSTPTSTFVTLTSTTLQPYPLQYQ